MQLRWIGQNGRSHTTPVESAHAAASLIARDKEMRLALNMPEHTWCLEVYNTEQREWHPWRGPNGEWDPIQYAEETPEPPAMTNEAMKPHEFRLHVIVFDDPKRPDIYRLWTDNLDPLLPGQQNRDDIFAAYLVETALDFRKALGLPPGDIQALAIGSATIQPGPPGEEDRVNIAFRILATQRLTDAQLAYLEENDA